MGAQNVKRLIEIAAKGSAIDLGSSTSPIKLDYICESTDGSGVQIDGVTLKDSNVRIPDDGGLYTDDISEATSSNGVTFNHKVNLGADTLHAGKLLGVGTSSGPFALGATAASGVSLYCQSTATADSNRTIYARLYLNAAGGGGEAVRAFGTAAASGTSLVALRGIHASTSVASGGTVAGVCEPVRATLQVPNSTLGGTCYGVHSELYAEGSSSNASNIALFGASLSGNSTGAAALDDVVNLFNIQGGAINTGNLVCATAKASATHSIRIKVGSTTLYLMAADAVS